MPFSKTEQESVILNAVWDMIDDMVNYDMFVKAEKIHDTNLMFNTSMLRALDNPSPPKSAARNGKAGSNRPATRRETS
jgi:hypothetical protein